MQICTFIPSELVAIISWGALLYPKVTQYHQLFINRHHTLHNTTLHTTTPPHRNPVEFTLIRHDGFSRAVPGAIDQTR